MIEAERAARGELTGETRAKIELVNYVEALDLIDHRLATETLTLTLDLLPELHRITTRGLGRENDPHFKPHHEGAWRDGRAVVFDPLAGKVMHEGLPAHEVAPRIGGIFEWLNRGLDAGDPSFVAAGVVHYAITDVHPFADGNGRVARLLQTAVLMHAGVLPGRMFSFERYYAEDRPAYYAALRSVRQRTLNMEVWLDYFLRGLAEEYERVATTIFDLNALIPGGRETPLRLTPGQERALMALRIEGRREFTRREYEHAGGVSRSSAGDDLRALVRHGVLTSRGASRSTHYVLASPVIAHPDPRRSGRPTKWTDAKIETELRAFVKDKTRWPTPREFRAAGKGALYAAATKAGGIPRWRRIVGL